MEWCTGTAKTNNGYSMDLKSSVYMFNNVGVVGELEVADPNIQDNEIAEFGRFITVYQVSLQFTTARVQRLN